MAPRRDTTALPGGDDHDWYRRQVAPVTLGHSEGGHQNQEVRYLGTSVGSAGASEGGFHEPTETPQFRALRIEDVEVHGAE
jgi:hypothetical protein